MAGTKRLREARRPLFSSPAKTPNSTSSTSFVLAGLAATLRKWSFCRFLFHSVLLVSVKAQQSPFTTVSKFDTSVSYRTDLCPRQSQIWDGTRAFPDGLRGLNLTLAIADRPSGKEKFLFSLENGKIPEKDPGYFAIILDEVARRAGFSWRDTFAVYEPRNETTDGNKTWTDILLWSIEVFDISMAKWGHSVDRMAMGVSFPIGFFDGSLVLGELYVPSQSTRTLDLWSFLDPFDTSLWLMIVATVIFSGMVYWLIEHWNKCAEDGRELFTRPMANIFYAAIAFTGHYQIEPKTHPARVLAFSLTFCALIVSSSYTANLASFLVSPRVDNYKYSTIEEVVADGATVCMQGGGILLNTLQTKYPGIKIVGKDSEKDIFTSLRLPLSDGGCDVVGHDFNMFELYENDKEVNFDCALRSEKRIALVQPSGMATAIVDSCTSLVSHVLDYHLASMIDDGFIELAWKNHLSRQGTIECIQDPSQNGWFDDSDNFSLTIVDVGGIFIVHVVLSLSAIAIAIGQFYFKYKKGLLHESRNLKSAFGVDFARKKLLKSKGRRSLIIDEGDFASETGSHRMALDSSSVANSVGSAINELEFDGLATETSADISCRQNNDFEGEQGKGTGDTLQDKTPSENAAVAEIVHGNSNAIRDSPTALTNSIQCGIDDRFAQDSSKEEPENEEMSERITM